jgi:hypothetical protein
MENDKDTVTQEEAIEDTQIDDLPEEKSELADLGVEDAQAESVKGGTQTRQSSVVVDM